MKLLLCAACSDVFKLDYDMRKCKCGRIKGRYIDNVHAEVSAEAISIAIGNGSLYAACGDMKDNQSETKDTAPRESYYEDGKGRISHAWVRPNTGNGNPHTTIIIEPN